MSAKDAQVLSGLVVGVTLIFVAVWLIKAWQDRHNKKAEHQDLIHAWKDARTGFKIANFASHI